MYPNLTIQKAALIVADKMNETCNMVILTEGVSRINYGMQVVNMGCTTYKSSFYFLELEYVRDSQSFQYKLLTSI